MTRKDYEAVAKVLNANRYRHASKSVDTVDAIARDLADIFAADNPRFDSTKFLNAVTA